MNLFSRRSRAGTSPVGAVVEGDAEIFVWRAELRARLDDEISRATTVTLAAAKSWARREDPPPGDAYLAEALRNSGLWGSTVEPGTHISRWSEEDRSVTLRAWDWDLSRPLSDGGYAPMTRVRTLPWPTKSGEAHESVAKDDQELRGGDSDSARRPVEYSRSPREGSADVWGESRGHQDFPLSESPTILARPRVNQNVVTLAGLLILMAVGVLGILAAGEFSFPLDFLLRIILPCSMVYWLYRRGWMGERGKKGSRPNPELTVGDGLARHQKALHVLWRALVAALVCVFVSTIISASLDIGPGLLPLGLIVAILVTNLWYRRFANRPADP